MNIICFSHLRWDFVYQRPQHLLSRAAEHFQVFYVEEPLWTDQPDHLAIRQVQENIQVVTPTLEHSASEPPEHRIGMLLEQWDRGNFTPFVAWFYTPMALGLLEAFNEPALVVYDCMDELSAFKNAPPRMVELERELLRRADLVFTGGRSLYEAKRHLHPNIYSFPSSIDKAHFGRARNQDISEPHDQAMIPHPRIGFFGVIDERLDIELIRELAQSRGDWHFVLIGPVVKIDPATLPNSPNIHYLGGRSYDELPGYLSGWDVALIPFALNESTKFISPTKTPEYLAGGIPVVSSAIRDVVNPYGEEDLVAIATGTAGFEEGIALGLKLKANTGWKRSVDAFLANISWDATWDGMEMLIRERIKETSTKEIQTKEGSYV